VDIVNKSTKWIDHNRGTFVAFLVMAAMAGSILFMGCESKAVGIVPDVKVDRVGLNQQLIDAGAGFDKREANITAMVATLNAEKLAVKKKIDAAIVELDRQDQFKADIIQTIGKVGMSLADGTFNPMSLIPIAIGFGGLAYGGGKKYDNVRKDKVIADNKST